MRPVESKGSCSHESAQDHHSCNAYSFEFHNGAGPTKALHHHKALGSRAKPTPSKWDDAQKWLVGLSARADHKHSVSKPRNSNADDRRLLTSLSQRGRDSCSSADGVLEDDMALAVAAQEAAETKKVDCNEPLWRTSKPSEDSPVVVRSVCLRDASTEMTPIASKEPSRTGTPLRATTPVLKSPLSSRSSTPGRSRQGAEQHDDHQPGMRNPERRSEAVPFGRSSGNGWPCRGEAAPHIDGSKYKREEVKIQAWENHEKRKAETEMRRMEVKAERMRSRAQEKYASRLAAARRMAEEKRANAEGRLNEHAARTSDRADYIRRTGHLPSSFFSFKLSSLCG